MLFFKYLANILQHSSLNGCFDEDSENKTSMYFQWSLSVFIVVMVMSVWTHYKYDNYKMKISSLLISFKSGTVNEKVFELKKVLEYS